MEILSNLNFSWVGLGLISIGFALFQWWYSLQTKIHQAKKTKRKRFATKNRQ